MKPIEEAEVEPNDRAADVGKDGSHKSDDKVASLENTGKPVEEHVHQTISESFFKEGDLNNNTENLDEKILDMRSDNGGKIDEVSHESLVSDAEWVCKSPNGGFSSTASGWSSFNTKSCTHTYSLSAEEQASVAVLHLQHNALKACQEFLVGNAGSDYDEDDNDEDEDEDDEDEDEDELVDNYDSEECEEYKFFLRVFIEDNDLRRYYENNCREGDFYCLVCGGIGKKVWKRFKDCNALLQHSTAILRTKRKQAHRAYAHVICKVVGWDIDRLPVIVLKGLGSSLAGSSKLLVEPKKPAASHIDDSNGEPDNPADGHIDDSDVLQESAGKVNSDCDVVSRGAHVVHHNNGEPTDSDLR